MGPDRGEGGGEVQLHVDFDDATRGLQQAVYDAVRGYILTGQLVGGARLPPTRELARQLRVSRNTVTLAYERLIGEDLVEGRERSGLFVRPLVGLPVTEASAGPRAGHIDPNVRELVGLYSYVSQAERLRPFAVGTPALDQLPLRQWAKLARRRLRSIDHEMLGYGDPLGFRPLREAICEHLAVARGVRCSPDQVLICAGAQSGLYLCSLILCGSGGEAWVEEPGYGGAARAISAAGGISVPVSVDEAGLCVKEGIERAPLARLAVVSPSNQFPTGVAMSARRRVALLNWAEQSDAWIFEDDYDSEFRFDGRPLTALYALQFGAGLGHRVIYCGSFSKTLFPALKLAYLVLPPVVVDMFVALRSMIGREPPILEQAVLADFIAEGHFARHLRRMRGVYAERATALQRAVGREFRDRLELAPVTGGLQALARFAPGESPAGWTEAGEAVGARLEIVRTDRGTRDALVMGFANMTPAHIDQTLRALSDTPALCRPAAAST
jgi:GntR family transcriptional regulator/MocR family aminotransferase